jgi:Mrp family chromosome partitioning ATPase
MKLNRGALFHSITLPFYQVAMPSRSRTVLKGNDDPMKRNLIHRSAESATDEAAEARFAERPGAHASDPGAVVVLPTVHPTPVTVARSESLRRLCEQLSPVAVVDNNLRLLISGCASGDGTSTIAAAFALDLSQRLSLRTLLIDAHLRRPALHRMFTHANDKKCVLMLNGPMQIRSTGWNWLDVATCCLGSSETERREALAQCEDIASHYATVVIDLGVVRLDARMLPLARETDPILLVVRHGHTRRQELATTAIALRAAKRTVAGVILNAATNPVAPFAGKTKPQ